MLHRLGGEVPADRLDPRTVLFFVRLPRIAAAILVGAALAAAGAAYQGLFRNPLVSPDILGVSAGAGLGAVLGIFLSLPVIGIQLLAFVVGLAHGRPRALDRRLGARPRAGAGAGAGGRGGRARSPAP